MSHATKLFLARPPKVSLVDKNSAFFGWVTLFLHKEFKSLAIYVESCHKVTTRAQEIDGSHGIVNTGYGSSEPASFGHLCDPSTQGEFSTLS